MPAPDSTQPDAAPSRPARCTAFDGHRRLASGPLSEVAIQVKRAADNGAAGPLLIFDDATGRVIDVDTRGTEAEVAARLFAGAGSTEPNDAASASAAPTEMAGGDDEAPARRGRGRPRLGVVAREVTLLPRHWEWLSTQRGGASVALRRLVEAARRASEGQDRERQARNAAYRFMHALAGDLPGFEEAARALFAGERERFGDLVAAWPKDVRDHAVALASAAGDGDGGESIPGSPPT
ncbi:MAG: hypothetical protein JWM27_1730 [Gemmatimonadetes bacterium]|nr:hypothetical protein [Gemmatimonadota bacterium]